jgi:putative hydrolase of the HAD superfamily
MSITHILFDLYGTLSDSSRMYPCYAQALGQVMSARFGGTPEAWAEANRRIAADWDSYYADLDLEGEHGIDDMWEGEYRTTRALFRLAGVTEPEQSALMALARELPYQATRLCDTFYPDAKAVIPQLHAAGYVLGIASHTLTGQARGTLEGAGMLRYFSGPILGPDFTGEFAKNRAYYQSALRDGLPPESVLVVDDKPDGIQGAKAAGMRAVHLLREGAATLSPADHTLLGDLSGLADYLRLLT